MVTASSTDRTYHSRRVERLVGILEEWVAGDSRWGATVHLARRGEVVLERGFGQVVPLDGGQQQSTTPETIYLIASLTKPVTAAAVALLIERGHLLLDDPVSALLPGFGGGERREVRIRHLLTHTSGLPDMLPENTVLRARHAPLEAFTEGTCQTPLLFTPGNDCRYQSMGIMLLGAIVERLSGLSLREFVAREFLRPLGMAGSWLGLGRLPRERVARVNIGPEEEGTDWHWNSAYWRDLGAPWGGMHATAADYARFLELFLSAGRRGDEQILASATSAMMLSNQLAALPSLSEATKATQAWGLGWQLNWPAGSGHLPELGSMQTFGHLGATGTMAWADPVSGLSCVLLTNCPGAGRLRSLVSNAAAALAG